MKCIICGCSAQQRMLHRTKPLGQPDMGAMCLPCMEIKEPELAANVKQDMEQEPVLSDLHEIFYTKAR